MQPIFFFLFQQRNVDSFLLHRRLHCYRWTIVLISILRSSILLSQSPWILKCRCKVHRFIVFANNTRAFEGLLFIAIIIHRFVNSWLAYGKPRERNVAAVIYSRNVCINVYSAAKEFLFSKAPLEALISQISRHISIRNTQRYKTSTMSDKMSVVFSWILLHSSSGAIWIESRLDASTRRANDTGLSTGLTEKQIPTQWMMVKKLN